MPGGPLDLDELWSAWGQTAYRRSPAYARLLIETTVRREIEAAEARREARFRSSAEEIVAQVRAADAARRGMSAPAPEPADPFHGAPVARIAPADPVET